MEERERERQLQRREIEIEGDVSEVMPEKKRVGHGQLFEVTVTVAKPKLN